MPQKMIPIAIAAAAVVGLGAISPGAVTRAAADTVTSRVTELSAQQSERKAQRPEQRNERKGERREGAQERKQEQRREGAQERKQEQRREGAQERREDRREGREDARERREDRREARPDPRGGPRIVGRIRGGGPIRLGGRDVVVIRGSHSVQWRGRRRNLVPLAAIAVLTVGTAAYAANAYVPVAEPVCTGYTEGGCFFRWAEVPTPEGDLIPQCVAYCPR